MTEMVEKKQNMAVRLQNMLEIRKYTKKTAPLVHCITNPISIHDCANVVLAVGARPIMAEHPGEVEAITKASSALMLNLGNITDARIESMQRSLRVAKEQKIPVLLDLVGVTCSRLRYDFAKQLLQIGGVSVIKGNISEILAVADLPFHGTGIDAGAQDAVSDENKAAYGSIAKALAAHLECTVMATGKQDLVADARNAFLVSNGHEALSRITGTGCMVGALAAAYLPAGQVSKIHASLLAVVSMGLSGEYAAAASRGPGSFQTELLDEIYCMTDERIMREAKICPL